MKKAIDIDGKRFYLDNRDLPFIKYDKNGFPWIVTTIPKDIIEHSYDDWNIIYAQRTIDIITHSLAKAIEKIIGNVLFLPNFDFENMICDDFIKCYKILKYILIYADKSFIGISNEDINSFEYSRDMSKLQDFEYVIELSVHFINNDLGQELISIHENTGNMIFKSQNDIDQTMLRKLNKKRKNNEIIEGYFKKQRF